MPALTASVASSYGTLLSQLLQAAAAVLQMARSFDILSYPIFATVSRRPLTNEGAMLDPPPCHQPLQRRQWCSANWLLVRVGLADPVAGLKAQTRSAGKRLPAGKNPGNL